jgi:hypothetical protein
MINVIGWETILLQKKFDKTKPVFVYVKVETEAKEMKSSMN